MPKKDDKKSTARKGLPKAAKQAAKAIKQQSANKQGTTYLPKGERGARLKSGYKYKDESKAVPAHRRWSGQENRSYSDKSSQAITNRLDKFKASQRKLKGSSGPSLGIAGRTARKAAQRKGTFGYNGMRPGPLR